MFTLLPFSCIHPERSDFHDAPIQGGYPQSTSCDALSKPWMLRFHLPSSEAGDFDLN